MKKLLMVVLAFVGITCGALAQEYKNAAGEICAAMDIEYKKRNNAELEKWAEVDGIMHMYFDTGSSEDIKQMDGCEEQHKKMVEDFCRVHKDDVEELVIIGNADAPGKPAINNNLSKRRANYGLNLLEDSPCKDVYMRQFVTGDVDAEWWETVQNSKGANQNFRSVDIYVIWRQAACDITALNYLHDRKEDISKYTGKADLSEIKAAIDKLQVFCTGNPYHTASDSEEFQRLWADLMNKMWAVIKANGSDAPFRTEVAEEGDIIRYYNNLTQMRNELFGKVNVRRNAEGKFNTARLASDSIAGVVLGTAGGLITSHLVKKNQVKTGFEDIQCTVGGQRVADWGDEFMVGIR